MPPNRELQRKLAPKDKPLLGVLFLRGVETEKVFDPNRKTGLLDGLDFEKINGPSYYTSHLKRWLAEAGVRVLHATRHAMYVEATVACYEQITNAKVVEVARQVNKRPASQPEDAEFFFFEKDGRISSAERLIDPDISKAAVWLGLEAPAYYASEFKGALSPRLGQHYIKPPNDIQIALNANVSHRQGITGKGVLLAMVDSGISDHPYHRQQHYRVRWPTPDDAEDLLGHGTGEVANLFAVAPDVDLVSVKRRNIADNALALARAIDLGPRIINCSWGYSLTDIMFSTHQALEAEILRASEKGILIVAAMGNGLPGFPAQHPNVLAVGAFTTNKGWSSTKAEYSLQGESQIYPGRLFPDVLGIAGHSTAAPYIHLPVPAGSEYDRERSAFQQDNAAEVEDDIYRDGWAAFSGTSAASPQVAGACALLLQVNSDLRPHEIKDAIVRTARPVDVDPDETIGRALDVGAAVDFVLRQI